MKTVKCRTLKFFLNCKIWYIEKFWKLKNLVKYKIFLNWPNFQKESMIFFEISSTKNFPLHWEKKLFRNPQHLSKWMNLEKKIFILFLIDTIEVSIYIIRGVITSPNLPRVKTPCRSCRINITTQEQFEWWEIRRCTSVGCGMRA